MARHDPKFTIDVFDGGKSDQYGQAVLVDTDMALDWDEAYNVAMDFRLEYDAAMPGEPKVQRYVIEIRAYV